VNLARFRRPKATCSLSYAEYRPNKNIAERGTARATVKMVMEESAYKRMSCLLPRGLCLKSDTTFTLSPNHFPTSPSAPSLTQYRWRILVQMPQRLPRNGGGKKGKITDP
jgi:hypothetical protein